MKGSGEETQTSRSDRTTWSSVTELDLEFLQDKRVSIWFK